MVKGHAPRVGSIGKSVAGEGHGLASMAKAAGVLVCASAAHVGVCVDGAAGTGGVGEVGDAAAVGVSRKGVG